MWVQRNICAVLCLPRGAYPEDTCYSPLSLEPRKPNSEKSRVLRTDYCTGCERKSAHIWYVRRLRDSPTLSQPVLFALEAGPSTASMYTSERARFSKGYRAAKLHRTLGDGIGTDRGEVRGRYSASLSPSNQRLPWPHGGGWQRHGPCWLALELRGEQQVPFQVWSDTCSSTPRTQCWKHPGQRAEGT